MISDSAIIALIISLCAATNGAVAGPPCELSGLEVSDPHAVNSNASLDGQGDNDGEPAIFCAGGTCLTVWSGPGIPGLYWDILVSRSTDQGQTWSSRSLLAAGDFDDYGVVLSGDGFGTWIAVWQRDLGASSTEIYSARSSDDGVTWSDAVLLNSNPGAIGALRPDVVYDGAGAWIAVWEGSSGGSGPGSQFGLQFTVSVDGGATWTPHAPIDAEAEVVPGAGDFYISTQADGNGRVIAAWSSSRDIAGAGSDFDLLMSITDDGGTTWSTPTPLNADAASDGTPTESQVQLATDGQGMWVAVFIRASSGILGDVLAQRSTDNGVTWSMPIRINVEPMSGLGANSTPQIAYNGQGRWLVVWDSITTYDNFLYTDHDLLAAVSDDGLSWSHEVAGNPFAASDFEFEDVSPALTHDGAGNWLLAWDSDFPPTLATGDDHDILLARLTPITTPDCNNNGISDACEILAGDVEDKNVDGVPDECQPLVPTPIRFHTIALIGETDPAGGMMDDVLGNQCLEDESVFYAFRSNPYGIAHWENGNASLIAASGMQAPGAPVGVNFGAAGTTFNDFAAAENGSVAFYAGLNGSGVTSANDFGIWHWDGKQVSLVVREGDTPQGAPRTVTWTNFQPTISNTPKPRISPSGVVGFVGKFGGAGINTSSDTGVWMWNNGTLTAIATEGLPAPGIDGTFGSFGLPLFDARGHVGFISGVLVNRRGIWFGTPSNLELVVLEDEQVPGQAKGVLSATVWDDMIVSENGHLIYRIRASGPGITFDNDDSIWRFHNGASELVVAAGQASSAEFDDAPFIHVQQLGVTPDGKVLFLGALDYPALGKNPRCVWLETDTGFALVAVEETPVPGGGAGRYFGSFSSNSHFAVNARNEVIFGCSVIGIPGRGVFGWTPNRGLFAVATPGSSFVADESEIGVATGASISGYDTGATFGPSATLNDNGRFSLSTSFENTGAIPGGLFLASFPDASDFNNDGVVDGADQEGLCSALGASTDDANYQLIFDLNGDGTIDQLDQAIFSQSFNNYCTGDIVNSITFLPPPDGIVDGADLAVLLGAWGDQPSCADLVNSDTFQPPPDGVVDGADLAILLGAWGMCN